MLSKDENIRIAKVIAAILILMIACIFILYAAYFGFIEDVFGKTVQYMFVFIIAVAFFMPSIAKAEMVR